jgi:glycosyltransferase involved in cell wall biosynthesis
MISVIIPTYNRTEQLQRAIDSVLKQTYTDFELIVVDDGSEVPVPEMKNVKIIRQKNRGVSAARNAGIRAARGEHIAFLDSDDEWLPKKLEKQIAYITEHPDLLISQCDDIWIRNGTRVNPHKKHQKKSGDIFLDSLRMCMISPSAVIMCRELFDQVGLFDEKLPACEDYDLWLRVTARFTVGLLEEKLIIRYAGHEDQLSAKYPVMDKFRLFSLHKVMKDREEVKKVFNEKKNIIANGALKRGRWWEWLYYRFLF